MDMDYDEDIDVLGAARFGNKICYWKNDLSTGFGNTMQQ